MLVRIIRVRICIGLKRMGMYDDRSVAELMGMQENRLVQDQQTDQTQNQVCKGSFDDIVTVDQIHESKVNEWRAKKIPNCGDIAKNLLFHKLHNELIVETEKPCQFFS